MANVVATKSMPGRSHHSAPKFDGTPSLLGVFFDDVEQLADACELTSKQKIEWALRYAPVDDAELWRQCPSAKEDDWSDFKSEIYALYPGSTGDRKYSVANLEMLTEKTAAIPMETALQYGEYYRAFSKIANFLMEKKRLTDREISSQFLQGFNYAFRNKVRAQLRAENPTHHTDDPYTLQQISSAAQFILSCNQDEIIRETSTQGAQVAVKREQFDFSDIAKQIGNSLNISVLAQEVAKYLGPPQRINPSGQANNGGNHAGYPMQTQMQYQPMDRPRSNECIFCSDPSHYLNHCMKAMEYVQKGLCKRNNEGQIVLPNGERVNPRVTFGRNLKERVDNWHANNNTGNHVVSTNLVSVSKIEEVKEEIVPAKSQFMWTEVCEDDDQGYLTAREEEDLELMESLIATTQRKVDDARKRTGNMNRTGPITRSNARDQQNKGGEQANMASKDDAYLSTRGGTGIPTSSAAAEHGKVGIPTNVQRTEHAQPMRGQGENTGKALGSTQEAQAAQYKYITPIESAAVIDKVAEQSLKTEINITMRELLAIAPDVRKYMKDQIMTKRVPMNGTQHGNLQSFLVDLPKRKDDLITSNHSEELRCIDVLFNGTTKVEGILDEGSQIIGLRKDIWESSGLVARSDYQVVMETANKSQDKSIGLLQDLKLTIGGYDFYVQAQVVENAPYELLLGLPFHVLTSLHHQFFKDGSSHVTLADPNTGAEIKIPTKARNRAPKAIEVQTVGF